LQFKPLQESLITLKLEADTKWGIYVQIGSARKRQIIPFL